ncbi:hypothetical protein [Pseudomonas syringae]
MAVLPHGTVSPRSSGMLALNPLIIPVMDYGSARPGLGWDDLNDPSKPVFLQARLNIQAYQPGDFVTLYWNDETVQTFSLEESHFQNSFMAFNLYPVSIVEPSGEVYYTIYDQLSESTAPSDKRTVRVKLSVPGGPDTDASTPYLNDRLTVASITPAGDITDENTPVSVTVAPWLYMAEGDELTVIWNGVRLTQPPLDSAQVGQPQTVVIPRETLIGAGDGSPVTVSYEIRDIVNNYSLVSRPAFTNVIVDPNAPPAPAVKVAGTRVSIIDLDQLGSGDVQVEIPHDNGIPAAGDSITLNWKGRAADGMPFEKVLGPATYPGGGLNLEFTVANADVVAIAGGGAVVSYLVQGKGSKRTTITVVGVPTELTAPLIPGVVGDIDIGVISDPVLVRIPAYAGKAENDVIFLSWEGLTEAGNALVFSDTYTVGNGEASIGKDMEVNKNLLTPLASGSLSISYRVNKPGGATLKSEVTAYSVSGSILLTIPTVLNAPGDIFDPAANPNGTSVHVDGVAAALKRLDEVTIYWTGPVQEGSASQTFTIASDNQSLDWPVLAAQIDPSRGSTVNVFYEVKRTAGGSGKSVTRTLAILDPLPNEITDDFTSRTGAMIRAGGTLSTDYITLFFESGNGQAGFPIRDDVPPDGAAALQLPVLHICYQHPANQPGTQVVLMDLRRDCSKIEFDIYGCNGKTRIDLLDAGKNIVETKTLPATTNHHFISTTALPIHFIRVTGETDWTLWDNIKMTTRNLARSKRK